MLTIICGEDTTASRKYFIDLQQEYKKNGYLIEKIQPNQIDEIGKSGADKLMLFNEKKVYALERLTTYTARKKSKDFLELLKKIVEDKALEILNWEDKSLRDIKIKATVTKEFKATESIFQLTDACYPGNLVQFISLLNKVTETQEEGFVFTMLTRNLRTILLAKTNQLPTTVPYWMKNKLTDQAQKWSLDGLIGMYDGFARIDVSLKTSSSTFGIKKSIEVLACYFLK